MCGRLYKEINGDRNPIRRKSSKRRFLKDVFTRIKMPKRISFYLMVYGSISQENTTIGIYAIYIHAYTPPDKALLIGRV